MNHVMQHLWDLDGKAITFPDQDSVQKLLRPEVVLFHRIKDGTLTDRLRERKLGAVVPDVKPMVSIDTVHGKTEPIMEILIVTYWKDAEWLEYCLRSIKKFAKGFSGVTIACPDKRNAKIVDLATKYKATLKLFSEPAGRGHLAQEVVKCNADRYCQGADLVLHMDSDCVFTENVSPGFYMHSGNPILPFRTYKWLEENPPKPPMKSPIIWQKTVEEAIGIISEVETMAGMPIIHHSWIYKLARNAVEQNTKKKFDEYVFSCKSDWPYGFCEFNTLGSIAWHSHKDSYSWCDVTKAGHPNLRVKQLWSHSGLDAEHPIQTVEGQPRQYLEMLLK
jgi:hypothetical protein